jgi:hypothetical protein
MVIAHGQLIGVVVVVRVSGSPPEGLDKESQ